jgi:hypothetical protein
MSNIVFKKATREKTKARIAIYGPSKSGKTWNAIRIANTITGGRFVVGDSENRSASLYAGRDGIDFYVHEFAPPYTPQQYVEFIHAAERSGEFDGIVIDSLSHPWAGEGGVLEQAERSKKTGNGFTAWADLTPAQNKLLSAIQHCKLHLICTLRSKTEYVLEERENRNGRTVQVPRRIGLAPIQRKELEYEFTVIGSLSASHDLTIEGSRVHTVDQKVINGDEIEDLAIAIRDFHESGAEPAPFEPTDIPPTSGPKRPTQPQQPTSRPSAPVATSAPPAARQPQQQAPRPLPTTLSKNYPKKEVAGLPFTTLSTVDLGHVVDTYRAKLNEPGLNEYHRTGVQGQLDAADAVLQERRRVMEEMSAENGMAGADPETGEVTSGPADDFRGQAASVG